MVGFDVGWIPVLSTIFEDFEVALFCEVSCMTKFFSSVNCYMYFWGSDFESEESYYEGLICIRPWVDGFICICAILVVFLIFLSFEVVLG